MAGQDAEAAGFVLSAQGHHIVAIDEHLRRRRDGEVERASCSGLLCGGFLGPASSSVPIM
jgi:hypothetical protein